MRHFFLTNDSRFFGGIFHRFSFLSLADRVGTVKFTARVPLVWPFGTAGGCGMGRSPLSRLYLLSAGEFSVPPKPKQTAPSTKSRTIYRHDQCFSEPTNVLSAGDNDLALQLYQSGSRRTVRIVTIGGGRGERGAIRLAVSFCLCERGYQRLYSAMRSFVFGFSVFGTVKFCVGCARATATNVVLGGKWLFVWVSPICGLRSSGVTKPGQSHLS